METIELTPKGKNNIDTVTSTKMAKEIRNDLLHDAKDMGTFHSARWWKDYIPDLFFVSKDMN